MLSATLADVGVAHGGTALGAVPRTDMRCPQNGKAFT